MRLSTLPKSTGVEVWRGMSPYLRGVPIVVIATLHSSNRKTGDMLSLWTIRGDMKPTEAVKTGQDKAICGDCKHRGPNPDNARGRTCYVNAGQAPLAIYRTWLHGGYPRVSFAQYPEVFKGRSVRFGAYGEPSLIPIDIVRRIARLANGWTGYTHQWQRLAIWKKCRPYLMASVDSVDEAKHATAQGWRYFRVRGPGEKCLPGEIDCPAPTHGTKCIDCKLCSGYRENRYGALPSVSIEAHGGPAIMHNVKRMYGE